MSSRWILLACQASLPSVEIQLEKAFLSNQHLCRVKRAADICQALLEPAENGMLCTCFLPQVLEVLIQLFWIVQILWIGQCLWPLHWIFVSPPPPIDPSHGEMWCWRSSLRKGWYKEYLSVTSCGYWGPNI